MKRILCLLATSFLSLTAFGQLRLAGIFSSDMVLQRDTTIAIWGWAAPGAKVTLKTSWDKKAYRAVAAQDSTWRMAVQTPGAGGPLTLTFRSGKETVSLTDVLSGEVWICSGQSNMEMPVRGFGPQRLEGAKDAILTAGEYANKVRLVMIREKTSATPQSDVDAVWTKAAPASVADASAVAYFYARRLTSVLGVPVGVVMNPWGGSWIESWMPREALQEALSDVPEGQREAILSHKDPADQPYPRELAAIWNSRVYPIVGFTARGFLWYQGCSNTAEAPLYGRMQDAMIRCWRQAWGAQMPFLFVTIAPHDYNDAPGLARPLVVEQQLSTLAHLPQVYAAVTETLGSRYLIHPPKKQEVADQLVMLAAERVYGQSTGLGCGFPYPDHIEFPAESWRQTDTWRPVAGYPAHLTSGPDHPGKVRIRFGNVPFGMGLFGKNEVTGFEVAGDDRVFHPAEARLMWWNWVEVSCEAVPEPQAVRYSFHNFVEGVDLESAMGVPVPCFRSDDWE
ncbi:MAG: sialate O-acetylesterase [Bacteroidales bacterium]|nr:sialate O-acetylesterase [Bacteroidales bacterium]